MKRIFSFFILVALTVVAYSIPARPGSFVITQKDGTKITVELIGDEFCSYYVNKANGQKMYRDTDGDLKAFSEQQFNKMVAGANQLRAFAEASRAKTMARNTAARSGQHKVGDFRPMKGSQKGLIILVNFSDKSMASAHTQSVFDNQFNQEGYTQNNQPGSLHDYFYDQSYGQFDLTFDVIGPVTVSKNMAYYGAPKTIEISGQTMSMNDSYPGTMVREACQLADSQYDVDFSKYDWDKDGYVDQVLIIYAGFSQASGAPANTIWPHEWNLYSASYYGDGDGPLSVDGVIVNTYACANELAGTSGSSLNGIGAACHEFSHCLGYPDFYDTGGSGGVGMSFWDVMHGGCYNGSNCCGEAPAGYTAYERWMAGWIEPVELFEGKTITDMKPLNDNPEAYIIYNDKNRNEYLLVENHYSDKWFKYLYSLDVGAKGLLVTHVDYNASDWSSNTPNNDPNHQRMTWIPANKSRTESYSSFKGQLFPGSSKVESLTETSHADYGGKWFTACSTGSTDFNHTLKEITYNSTTHNVSFLFDDGDLVDDGSRYTVHYVLGSGTMEGDTIWKQTEFREKYTLPEATGKYSGYKFIGWSMTNIDRATDKPTIIAAGTEFEPKADITYYAVYKYIYTNPYNEGYQLASTINNGNDYILVNSNKAGTGYCVDVDNFATATAVAVSGTEIQIIDKNGTPTIATASPSVVWNCPSASGSSVTLVNDDNYLTIDKTGLSLSTSSASLAWGSNYGLYKTINLAKYYVHSDDGVFYVTSSSSSTNRLYAFQWTGKQPVTYYATTFYGDGDIDGDGTASLEDVSGIKNLIIDNSGFSPEADLNGDGKNTVDDVTLLISNLKK